MTARTRRVHGRPETPAETRFFDLRESGYQGPIDQDGNPIPDGTEADVLRPLTRGSALHRDTVVAGPCTQGKTSVEVSAGWVALADQMTELRAENEQLRAELDAANDAVVDLIGQLEVVERLAAGEVVA